MNTAVNPRLLETMIAAYPGTAAQKERAYAAAAEYTALHGKPPYNDICLALGLFQAIIQAARSGEKGE